MKMHFILAVLMVIVSGMLAFSVLSGSARDMEYRIVFGDVKQPEVFVKLNSRVHGYSVSKTPEALTLSIHLNETESGEVSIGLIGASGTLYYEDEQAHAGGKAWLKFNNGKVDVEYFQQNFL